MPSSRPEPIAIHRAPLRTSRVVLLLVVAAVVALLADQLMASSPSTAPAARERRALPPEVPGAAGLDPALRRALRRAARDAADDGVGLRVDSGRRSREHQQRLLDEAIVKYGSEEEAARWVATPDTSAHVSGDAVDIRPPEAAAWLSRNGAQYGLCQIYGNESWHYELRPLAHVEGCPPVYPDPTHDPRLRP